MTAGGLPEDRKFAGAHGRGCRSGGFGSIRLEGLPATRAEPLDRTEADLVLHTRAALHPIAEIDIGQVGARGAGDVIHNDVGAETRTVFIVRLEEAVDHR